MKLYGLLVIFIVGAAIGYLAAVIFRGYREHIVKIDRPLQIVTAEEGQPKFWLPTGTTLYFDGADNKAPYTRYRLYVNVEGEPYRVHPTEHPWYVAPIIGRRKVDDK